MAEFAAQLAGCAASGDDLCGNFCGDRLLAQVAPLLAGEAEREIEVEPDLEERDDLDDGDVGRATRPDTGSAVLPATALASGEGGMRHDDSTDGTGRSRVNARAHSS